MIFELQSANEYTQEMEEDRNKWFEIALILLKRIKILLDQLNGMQEENNASCDSGPVSTSNTNEQRMSGVNLRASSLNASSSMMSNPFHYLPEDEDEADTLDGFTPMLMMP